MFLPFTLSCTDEESYSTASTETVRVVRTRSEVLEPVADSLVTFLVKISILSCEVDSNDRY